MTAETEHDNTVLFTITNSKHLNGVQMSFPQAQDTKLGLLDRLIKKTAKPIVEVETVPDTTPVVAKKKYNMSGKYKGVHAKKKQARKEYMKRCPVVGCEHKGTNLGLSLHKRMSHGISPDGEVHETFQHANRHGGGSEPKPVKHPVVKLQDGTYRVLLSGADTKTDFLN